MDSIFGTDYIRLQDSLKQANEALEEAERNVRSFLLCATTRRGTMVDYENTAERQDYIQWLSLQCVQLKTERVRDDIQKQMELHKERYELTIKLQKAEHRMDFFECRHASQKTPNEFLDIDQDIRELKYKIMEVEKQMDSKTGMSDMDSSNSTGAAP